MRRHAVALAVVVVAGGLAAVLPAGATGGAATGDAVSNGATGDAPSDGPGPTVALARQNESNRTSDGARPPERWRRTYGGDGDDAFADLARTGDGGYLLVGWKGGEDRDGWVVKVDADGRKRWAKTLGGAGSDRLRGVVATDSGYLLAGRTTVDGATEGWLVELGADGSVREERAAGAGAFYAVERRESSAGAEYLLAGWTPTDGGGADGWAVALSANGSRSWERRYPAPEGYHSGILRAVVPTDAGYYLAGKVEGDSDDGWALRVGDDGGTDWQTAVGGSSRDDVWAAAPAASVVSATGSGGNATAGLADAGAGFVLVGETESDSTGPRDGWLVRFGPEGGVEWERRPGGDGVQWLDSAMRTEAGYLFTGGSESGPNGGMDGYALATDDAGDPRWLSHHGTDGWDKPWPAIRAHGGGYLLAGMTSGAGSGGMDGWLVRIGPASTSDGATDEGSADETTTDDAGDATEAGMQGDAPTDTGTADGPIPGFGVGAALVALVVLVAVLLAGRE